MHFIRGFTSPIKLVTRKLCRDFTNCPLSCRAKLPRKTESERFGPICRGSFTKCVGGEKEVRLCPHCPARFNSALVLALHRVLCEASLHVSVSLKRASFILRGFKGPKTSID